MQTITEAAESKRRMQNDMYQAFKEDFVLPMRELLYNDPVIPYDPEKALRLRDALLAAYPDILLRTDALADDEEDSSLMLRLLTEKVFLLDPYPVPLTAARNPEEKKYSLLFRQLVHELLGELSGRYANGDFYDVVPVEEIPQDFQGRIPVWLIWWQGEEQAPEIVKLCINSLRRAIPEDLADIRFITKENYLNYVRFPERVNALFTSGKITITHFSDMLRTQLLYRYGGLYVDATFLVRRPLPREWFAEEAFYTPRLDPPDPQYVSQGRWFANFMKTPAGSVLPRYMLNAFYCYWSVLEEIADYFLMDMIVEEGVREVPAIRDMILNNPPSQPHIEHLVHNLNSPYAPQVDGVLMQNTSIFKLTYKLPFYKEAEDGRETLYGHISREING